MKYILFDYIKIENYDEIKNFYYDYFVVLMKRIYLDCWERKNINFIALIKNPDLLKNYDFFIKSEEKFHKFVVYFECQLINLIENINNKNLCEISKNEILEFSEIEEEILNIKNDESEKTKILNSKYIINPKLERSSNFYNCRKEYIPHIKQRELIKNKILLIKNFNPNYTKRANIDKKILRKFKHFLKENNSKNAKNSEILQNLNLQAKQFINKFLSENLFPPVKVAENVEFKSFNTSYLLWLFSKGGIAELYELFVKDHGKEVLDTLISDYSLEDDKVSVEHLQNYIYNLAEATAHNNNNTGNTTTLKTISYLDKGKYDLSVNTANTNLTTISLTNKINTHEAPLNPLEVYENYVGLDFDIVPIKNNLFDIKYRKKRKNAKSDSEHNSSLERSRENDNSIFKYLIKKEIGEKEE